MGSRRRSCAKQTSAAEAEREGGGEEGSRKKIDFSARHAPLSSALAGPLWRISIVLTTSRGARRKRAPETRAMLDKRSKPFLLSPEHGFSPSGRERRCLFWKEKKKKGAVLVRAPAHPLFHSQNHPSVLNNRSRPPSTRPSAPDLTSPCRSW